MAELMLRSDLALGAGGSTTWERCAMGLPALITVIADNQEEMAIEGEARGFQVVLGRSGAVTEAMIAERIRVSMEQRDLWAEMSTRAMETVDARGTERVIHEMRTLR
jgi:UDP-2,4-diacetamido-2,4,6-trideoxy-beta-L-altropyranose hydrolase